MDKTKKIAFSEKIYLLGQDADGVNYWLAAPTWNCGWYWGCGYVKTYTCNNHPEYARDIESHQHFKGLFLDNEIFDGFKNKLIETPFSNSEIWQLLELMQEVYTLKEAAEMFGRGGCHITSIKNSIIENVEITKKINEIYLPDLFKKIEVLLTTTEELKK